MNEKSVQRFDP